MKNMFQRVPVDQSPVGEPERRGDERSEAARSGGSSTGERAADPDPEVPAKAQRRRFTAEYRLRILKQADACKKPGELGALLRREGLYTSHAHELAPAARPRRVAPRCGDAVGARRRVQSIPA